MFHLLADFGSTAVDEHRLHADIPQKHDIFDDALHETLVDHRVAANLDDDERSVKLTNVGQRFDENLLPLHLPLVPTENRNIFLRAHPQAFHRSSRTLGESLAPKAICLEDCVTRGER